MSEHFLVLTMLGAREHFVHSDRLEVKLSQIETFTSNSSSETALDERPVCSKWQPAAHVGSLSRDLPQN